MFDHKEIVWQFINNRRFNTGQFSARSDDFWRSLVMTGTELWLDTGNVEEARLNWSEEIKALTTNNTLLNKEVQKGIYDHLILEASEILRPLSRSERIVEIAFILNAVHGLRLSAELDTKVSVELHTVTTDRFDKIVEYGKRFHAIAPDRFIIKVPWSAAGILGARQLAAEGIPVNFTLGFSARQNYFTAALARPAYLNVFVGRIGSFVSQNGLGSGNGVGEATANATGDAMKEIRFKEAVAVKLIIASIRDVSQLYSLAGAPVFTIPPAIAEEARRAGKLPFTSSFGTPRPLDGYYSESLPYIECFWQIDDEFKAFVDKLSHDIPESPEELERIVRENGFGWLFPRLSEKERSQMRTDGKIPVLANWKKRVDKGEMAPDILMALSGLLSFTTDQTELDSRISGIMS